MEVDVNTSNHFHEKSDPLSPFTPDSLSINSLCSEV